MREQFCRIEMGCSVNKPVLQSLAPSDIGINPNEAIKSPQKTCLEPHTAAHKKVVAKFHPNVAARYKLKAIIGKGCFSRVYRVEHRLTGRPFAIKMTRKRDDRSICRVELNVLRRVRHANVIQLIEVFDTHNAMYYVLELATGGELLDRIHELGCFTERDATRVLDMVIDGVRYLHSLGITHRDLKPENLLYYHPGPDSKILITDFGLSAFSKTANNHNMETACGTLEYIAPEILVRKPYTCQVDMWSLGVIAYVLLSGTFPFDDENRRRMFRLILKVRYSFSASVSQTRLNSCPYERAGFC